MPPSWLDAQGNKHSSFGGATKGSLSFGSKDKDCWKAGGIPITDQKTCERVVKDLSFEAYHAHRAKLDEDESIAAPVYDFRVPTTKLEEYRGDFPPFCSFTVDTVNGVIKASFVDLGLQNRDCRNDYDDSNVQCVCIKSKSKYFTFPDLKTFQLLWS